MKSVRFVLWGAQRVLVLSLLSVAMHADALSISILDPNQIGAAGGVVTFEGTITNNSGFDLQSTDLFLNFSGFDPVNVTLDQLLGSTSFTIPNGATSGTTDLFDFTLAATAAPDTYSAQVTLQDAVGDISQTQTVTVTTVPEPGSLVLLGSGLCVFVLILRRRIKLTLPVVLLAVMSEIATAQVSMVKFVTNAPGLGSAGATLMVGAPIVNNGTVSASNVQVTAATLQGLASTSSFPVALGTLAPAQSVVVQTNFNISSLTPNTSYLLTIRGTYQVGSVTAGFSVNRFIKLPVASPGSNTLLTASAGSQFVTGAPFPPHPPQMDGLVNFPRPPIPTGPFVAGTPTPTGTGVTAFPRTSGRVSQGPFQPSVIFDLNSSLGINSAGTNCSPGTPPSSCAEPSGASGGGVVFISANWTAAYSTDGGNNFTQINPTTIFPTDAIGFCCDQQVQYVPVIDRFIWLLQGNGGMRLASAAPQDIINSGGTSWTYWNLGPGTFGQPSGTGFDYPDTSVGNNNLYLSWDIGTSCPAGCTSGLEVVRIPLTQIQAGGTIFFDYTHPSDSSKAWGSHLTQDTGDEIFWAGHDGNSQLLVFSLAEGSNTYFWRDVGISSWANNTLSSKTPDGNDWLSFGFPGNSVIGATRSGSQLWFAWTAGTDSNFQQDHVELVTLDRANNFNKIQQVQVWNNSYAFAYPALATNLCTGEVGMSLGYGGNGNYENHVVGFWGDFVVYITTNSGSGVNRYGDYLTIRQDNSATFSALGYGISTDSMGNMQSDVRYVVFGRSCG